MNERKDYVDGPLCQEQRGFFFKDYYEFAATLDFLLTHEAEYEAMRGNGKAYVEKHYRWEVIVRRYGELIESMG